MEHYFLQWSETPLFGIALTLFFFALSQRFLKNHPVPLLNPMIIATALIIGFLVLADIPVKNYQVGGSMMTFLLGPATVALAVPLYRQFNTFKRYALPILGGIFLGVFVGLTSTVILSKIFGLDLQLIRSLLPKNTTTPYAIEVSQLIGGLPALTVAAVAIAGMFGSAVIPNIFKLIKVDDPVAMGVSTGTTSHAIGTAKAFEFSEEVGAMSSMAIGLAGIVTSMMIPLIMKLFLS